MKFRKIFGDAALVIIAIAMFATGVAATIIGAQLVINGSGHGDPLVVVCAIGALGAGVLGFAALLDLFERSTFRRRLRVKRERKRLVRSSDRNMIGSRNET